jgi:LPXTG-motif cell wall-anchored protein
VYPKSEAIALADVNKLPVPAMPMEFLTTITMPELDLNGPEIAALSAAPLKLEEPSGHEVQIAALFVASLDDPPALPEELPHTASPTPFIGLAGLVLLSAAGFLRLRAASAK